MEAKNWLKLVPDDDGIRSLLMSNVDLCERLSVDASYDYLTVRQRNEIEEVKRDESFVIPETFDYQKLQISNEAKQKLEEVRPTTLGSATRIPGITPATIFSLLKALKKPKELFAVWNSKANVFIWQEILFWRICYIFFLSLSVFLS